MCEEARPGAKCPQTSSYVNVHIPRGSFVHLLSVVQQQVMSIRGKHLTSLLSLTDVFKQISHFKSCAAGALAHGVRSPSNACSSLG